VQASAPNFLSAEELLFGPKPRDYLDEIKPKYAKSSSFFSALSAKLKDGENKNFTGLEKIEPKTKK